MDRPPEAQLILGNRTRMGLSIREAARRAGISEGSWRRTEGPGDKTRTADTIALMARATGVTHVQLEEAGRLDAAAKLVAIGPRAGGHRTATEKEMLAAVRRMEDEARRLRALLGDDTDDDEANGDPRQAS